MANTKITTNVIADNAVGITQLNVSDGSNGQALVTNGSGTLSFASVGVSGISSSADATAITIDANEKVGIGTGSPAQTLHVNSGASNVVARFESSDSIAVASFKDNNGEAEIGNIGNDIGFFPAGAEKARLTSGGNFGIGTSSPNAYSNVTTMTVNGTNQGRVDLEYGGTLGGSLLALSGETQLKASGSSQVLVIEVNDAERMRVNSTGEVHITSAGAAISPTIKHGGATGDVAKLRLINRSGQGADKGGLLELGAVTDDGVSRSDVFASVAGLKDNATSGNKAGYMQFMTSNGSSLAEKMRLDSNGLLLINQTSSNLTYGKLQVSAGGETAGHGGIVGFFDTDTSVGSSNVIQVLWFSGDNDATGGVFTRYRDGNSILGQVTAANGTQCSYGVSSDERLKENIVDASSQLNVINSIQVREFDWKVNGYHEVGMIAQELHAVVPSVVQEGGDDITEEPWTVDYGKLTPYLIKAIQEQQTIIDDLKSRIEALEG